MSGFPDCANCRLPWAQHAPHAPCPTSRPGRGTLTYYAKPLRPRPFLEQVAAELKRARTKFPSSRHSMTALMEEVGELAKAMLDESPERVYAEAVQVAAMAARVAEEGDPTHAAYRAERGIHPHPRSAQ